MNQDDVFIVRNHLVPLRLVLGLMEDADSPEETKSWALSALFHAGYTHDDDLRDYLHEALERKGLHPYSEYRVEETDQPEEEKTEEQVRIERKMFLSSLKTILENLMNRQDEQGNPLFYKKVHWWAVFRIFVDKKIDSLKENRYKEFIHLISTLDLKKVNASLDMSTLSNISQEIYRFPFSKWAAKRPVGEGARKLSAFDRMYEIALELQTQLTLARL